MANAVAGGGVTSVLVTRLRGAPTPAEPVIAAVSSADSDEVIRLLHRTARRDDGMARAVLDALLTVGDGTRRAAAADLVLVARRPATGRVLAVAAGALTSTRCAEIAVWVEPAHRRAGVGTRLVIALTRRLATRGYDTALAAIRTGDAAGMALAVTLGRRLNGTLEIAADGVTTLVLPGLRAAG